MIDEPDTDLDTEQLLEAVLATAIRETNLADVCVEVALPVLTAEDGAPVKIAAVHTFDQVGMLTLDRGVYLELSDGSAYTLSIGVYRRPHTASHLQPYAKRRTHHRRHH